MAEYKTFFLFFKLLINIFLPIPLLKRNPIILTLYGCSLFFLVVVLCFIKYKKISYFKKYLSREYIPSLKLATSVSIVDIISVICLYVAIYREENNFPKIKISIAIFHILLSFITLILLLSQRTRNKAIISYTIHKYKIGIIARDFEGNENCLKKGQPVEIISENDKEYVVKDSSNNSFIIAKNDLESILEVV